MGWRDVRTPASIMDVRLNYFWDTRSRVVHTKCRGIALSKWKRGAKEKERSFRTGDFAE